MTRMRNAVTLFLVVVAVLLGAMGPASADFADSVGLPTTTVATGTVAAPSSVTVDDSCWTSTSGYWDPLGRWGTTHSYNYAATVTWPASTTTPGVTGCRVTAYLDNGTAAVMAETDAATTSFSATVDQYYLQFQPQLSIVTLTGYGWTAESARSAVLTC
jgi:hypothetical protein